MPFRPKKILPNRHFQKGKSTETDPHFVLAAQQTREEILKAPSRTEIINFLLSCCDDECSYLEIGVRNPDANFNKIRAQTKWSVDPGVEFASNPVDFKMTSDQFFSKLHEGELLPSNIKFDVIFIDGLHLAEQVDKDINNSLHFIKRNGFIVLHDCNPPTEWHARENFQFKLSPAGGKWNGTTWKAFLKWRAEADLRSCCIDTDWGVGILSKTRNIGEPIKNAPTFFEYASFDRNRSELLNLIDFSELEERL